MRNLTKALQKCPYVAVYGTLKKGYGNHRLLREADFIGVGLTYDKFLLYDVGFPYAIPSESGLRLEVEVYRIPDETIFQALDWLEGYPTHYNRKIVKVELPTRNVDAWIYYTKTPAGCECKPLTTIWKGRSVDIYRWPCECKEGQRYPTEW